ncbi:uncharacterized protein LAESUDRAFT_718710, partial [Laetiporus sulphureus 93-53]
HNGRLTLGAGKRQQLSRAQQKMLLQYYSDHYPLVEIVDISTMSPQQGAVFLTTTVYVHDYLVLDGRRITPSRGVGWKAPNSIIQINLGNTRYVGELRAIITHRQVNIQESQHLVHVEWFIDLANMDTSAWEPYPELEVKFWEYNTYQDPLVSGPPALIPASYIQSQACRVTIKKFPVRPQGYETGDSDNARHENSASVPRKIWATTGLTRRPSTSLSTPSRSLFMCSLLTSSPSSCSSRSDDEDEDDEDISTSVGSSSKP